MDLHVVDTRSFRPNARGDGIRRDGCERLHAAIRASTDRDAA